MINDLLASIFDDPVDMWLPCIGAAVGILAGWWLDAQLRWRQRRAVREALVSERARMAGELHDLLGHGLVAVAMHARQLRGTSPEARAVVEQIDDIVHSACRRVREIVGTLRREPVAPSVLSEEVIELASRLPMARLSLLVRGAERRAVVPLAVRSTVLRLVQEGLANAAKYGSGAPVRVEIGFDHPLTVSVLSGNRGDPGSTRPQLGAGYGLAGLRERVLEHGGSFESGATGDGGFVVRACFPCPECKESDGGDLFECGKPAHCG